MTGRNLQECKCWSFGRTAPLLPDPKSVDTYPHGSGESCLRETNEAPQCNNILTGFDLPCQNSLSRTSRDGSCELLRVNSGISVIGVPPSTRDRVLAQAALPSEHQ